MSEGAMRIQRFQALVEASPEDELARFSLGNAYWEAGRYGEAKVHFEQALARKPDWMMAVMLLGRCHLELGEKEAAEAVLRKAHRLAVTQCHDGPREEIEGLLRELGGP